MSLYTVVFRVVILLLFCACQPYGGHAQRQTGPIIKDYGAVWSVPNPDAGVDTTMEYRVVFDIYQSGNDPGELSASLNTLARFLNMHGQAGVPKERLHVAGVIHNKASKDVMNDAAYRERYGIDNPNTGLLKQLQEAGVELYLCGQSAYSRNIDRQRMQPGIEVGLSAMTIILQLEEQGFRLIKF